jgi:hypothetical protein
MVGMWVAVLIRGLLFQMMWLERTPQEDLRNILTLLFEDDERPN